ncbi:MAG TPA: oxidoreductase [Phycisphaerae bacterium]|nr:oxidoreductase [Phycisphaerae bacterium]HRR85222.1 oxidoreductase [Phycisphaerae bacterium]
MSEKGKLAIYWAASCGGCEISILALNEKILDVANAFDIVFCPCIMDTKARDVEKMADGTIDVCLFNGGIRTSEQEYMAGLLRRKSKVLVAFGSCAYEGCIPGLANLTNRKEIFETCYIDCPSVDNPNEAVPVADTRVNGYRLTLPVFYDTVRTLGQTVKVDYYLPGCPPEAPRIWDAVAAILEGKLPPPGSVIGPETTVCDECQRKREEKKIKRFKRTWEVIPDEDKCLLEQGLLCCGPATRAGCGALCPQVNSPCIGCYGPNAGVEDFGARLMSALASVIDATDPDEIDEIIRQGIPDPVGTFYRFGLPHGFLRRAAAIPDAQRHELPLPKPAEERSK